MAPKKKTASGQGGRSNGAKGLAAELQEELDECIKENKGQGGGVLRIERLDGHLVFEGASGDTFENSGVKMFEVASITKAFTSAAVLLLWEQGKIPSLDSSINELLPGLPAGMLVIDGVDHFHEVTLRQLMMHRSGMTEYWEDGPKGPDGRNVFQRQFFADPDRVWKPLEIIALIPELEPAGLPGTVHNYSDTNYVLLGLLIEHITGETLAAAYQRLLFEPLGMAETYVNGGFISLDSAVSHRYDEDGEDISVRPRQSADWAGGGSVSDARDLAKFIRALATDSLFAKKETHEIMRTWRSTKGKSDKGLAYGLGLFLVNYQVAGVGQLWGHDGWCGSFMYYWPNVDQKLIFTGTLNNLNNEWQDLLTEVLKILKRHEARKTVEKALNW